MEQPWGQAWEGANTLSRRSGYQMIIGALSAHCVPTRHQGKTYWKGMSAPTLVTNPSLAPSALISRQIAATFAATDSRITRTPTSIPTISHNHLHNHGTSEMYLHFLSPVSMMDCSNDELLVKVCHGWQNHVQYT